jgi:hypothetical protein
MRRCLVSPDVMRLSKGTTTSAVAQCGLPMCEYMAAFALDALTPAPQAPARGAWEKVKRGRGGGTEYSLPSIPRWWFRAFGFVA